MFMYYRLLFLLLMGIAIFVFYRKTSLYNKEQQYSVIWTKKDIRPYYLLWIIWGLFLLFSLMFLFNPLEFSNVNQWSDNISKNGEQKKNTKPVYRQIIDQERQSELSWNKKVIITPITSWYYELITEDKNLIQVWWVADRSYPIPKPINTAYCKNEDKYWNLWSENGLDYNWFIYEYLNSNKKKDVVIWILDTWITRENAKLASHLIWTGRNVIKQNEDTLDIFWHWSHIVWIILQTFPNAHILPIKISDDDNENILKADIIAGLRYAIDQDVDIINMSFWWLEKDPVTNQLINEAISKWILVISAAWNDSQDVSLYYPANYSWVVSVWSIWKLWKSEFSNYWADVEMPWECIYSTSSWWDLVFMAWTSMSTPHLVWVLGSYLSLDNRVSQESEIIKLINKNLKTWNWKSILNMAKLFNIEDHNNKFYEKLSNINSVLTQIQTKLISLKWNLNDIWLKDVVRYIDKNKSTLNKDAKKIENLYESLNITEWFGVWLSKKIDNYISILRNLLSNDNVQLISKDRILWLSLWTESCRETDDKCSYIEKQNGCDDTIYPWYICWNFDILITWWVYLPLKWSHTYRTMANYQEILKFPVYQWEDKFVRGNKYIWEVELRGIPKKLAWQSSATVYFDVDKYWFLSVKAVDDSNWKNKVIKTKLTPVINSVENKWDDYNHTLTNVGYALDETKELINQINKFYNIDPRNYI